MGRGGHYIYIVNEDGTRSRGQWVSNKQHDKFVNSSVRQQDVMSQRRNAQQNGVSIKLGTNPSANTKKQTIEELSKRVGNIHPVYGGRISWYPPVNSVQRKKMEERISKMTPEEFDDYVKYLQDLGWRLGPDYES